MISEAHAAPLRHVVIGAGSAVFEMHRPALGMQEVQIVAVCDLDAEAAARRAPQGCPVYADYTQMLSEIDADVAVIMTPHTVHAQPAIDCLRAGLHVLVEKPMAVHAADADAMVRAAEETDRILAVNLQQRLRPEIIRARRALDEGLLGKVLRIDVSTAWPRTRRYYEDVPWRGAWTGEGGGVLLNQAPHDLDLLCHFAGGLPKRVVGWCRTMLHVIVAEDTVVANAEWADGLLARVHVTTAEAPAKARIDITGTAGRLRIEPAALRFDQLDRDFREHAADRAANPYAGPRAQSATLELADGEGTHAAIYRNLRHAILNGEPVAADGRQGRMSLELANAIMLSSQTQGPVELPLDRGRYVELLKAGPLTRAPGHTLSTGR